MAPPRKKKIPNESITESLIHTVSKDSSEFIVKYQVRPQLLKITIKEEEVAGILKIQEDVPIHVLSNWFHLPYLLIVRSTNQGTCLSNSSLY
ncbi:hypothetical protein Dimus_038432 [Dionaea muscipula]